MRKIHFHEKIIKKNCIYLWFINDSSAKIPQKRDFSNEKEELLKLIYLKPPTSIKIDRDWEMGKRVTG